MGLNQLCSEVVKILTTGSHQQEIDNTLAKYQKNEKNARNLLDKQTIKEQVPLNKKHKQHLSISLFCQIIHVIDAII